MRRNDSRSRLSARVCDNRRVTSADARDELEQKRLDHVNPRRPASPDLPARAGVVTSGLLCTGFSKEIAPTTRAPRPAHLNGDRDGHPAKSVVEGVPADRAPPLLIIHYELADGGGEMISLPLA